MTPREVEVLNILDGFGRARVRQIAKKIDTSVGYARHLLDYLAEKGYVDQLSKDAYQIVPKGIDAVISEYIHTLRALDRTIEKHLGDKRRIVGEIGRLKVRRECLGADVGMQQ